MRILVALCAIVVAMNLAATGLRGGDPAKDKEAARIAHFIQQLADVKFAARMAAAKELEILGQKALPALRNAAANDNDPEIRERAKRLVQKITKR